MSRGYEIAFARTARKELLRLGEALSVRILRRIEALGATPRPPASKKLEGAADLWRIRIGEYRVVYRIDDGARLVDVVAIRHRSDVYR